MKKLLIAILALSAFLNSHVLLGQTVTPNIGLQIPLYNQPNWQVPINYDLNRLDLLLGGQLPLPFLNPTRLQFAPVLFSALPACTSQLNAAVQGVSDSTTNVWGSIITGSGGLFVWAYCNGTNWIVAPSGAGGIPTSLTNPMTTFGDLLYGALSGTPARLAGNTTTTPMYLKSVGSGGVASAPTLSQIQFSDIALPTGVALVCNATTVFCASAYSGADLGVQYGNALSAAYAAGGGTVMPGSLQCPAQCHIGTANLVLGDGTDPVTVSLPVGTITRDTISATGLSAQILYNSNVTVYAYGTTISGPSDVTAVQQFYNGAGVSSVHWFGGAIVDTGSVTPGSAALQIGGLNLGGIPFVAPPSVSYAGYIGSNGAGSGTYYGNFAGALSHVAMYRTALSDAQIAQHYADSGSDSTYSAAVASDGAFSYYKLNDSTCAALADTIGSRNGTYVGTVTCGSGGQLWTDGATYASVLDGTTAYGLLPSYTWYNGGDFTVEGWAYLTSNANNYQGLFSSGQGLFTNAQWIAELVGNTGFTDYRYFSSTSQLVNNPTYQLPLNTWTYWAVKSNNNNVTFYWDGVPLSVGTDVSSSSFDYMSMSGADIGTLFNSLHGCTCYNKLSFDNSVGKSLGIETLNTSTFPYGDNQDVWDFGRVGGAAGVLDKGGNKFSYKNLSIENPTNASGTILWAGPYGTISAYTGSTYSVGDTVRPGGSTAVLTVNSVSNGAPTSYTVTTPGTGYTNGTNLATTALSGSGSGAKVDIVVSAYSILVSPGGSYAENFYEENSLGGAASPDYICGTGNYVIGTNFSASGSTYNPTYCIVPVSAYGSALSDQLAGPGTVPISLGLRGGAGAQPHIHWNENFQYDPYLQSAFQPAVSTAINLFPTGVGWGGNSSITYGKYGHSLWEVGLSKPHATLATGRTTFSQIANPGTPTVTAVGGTGTLSAPYGLVCKDANSGHTLVSSPVTTVSGPSSLGTLLTLSIVSGGSGYVSGDVGATITITGYRTGGSAASATIASVAGGKVTGVTLVSGGTGFLTLPSPGQGISTTFATSGGTGTGLTVTGTATYISIAWVPVDGCDSWTVLETDTAHALPGLSGAGAAGSTNASTNILDFGASYVSVSWPSTANTTGQVTTQNNTLDDGAGNASFGGTVNVVTGKGFTINNAAPSGHYLRGNATAYVDSAIQLGDLPSGTATELSGVSGSIGGSSLTVGQTVTGTVSITGASAAVTAGAVIDVTPVTQGDPGLGFTWQGYMSGSDTVTVVVTCVAASATPTATTYNVKVVK